MTPSHQKYSRSNELKLCTYKLLGSVPHTVDLIRGSQNRASVSMDKLMFQMLAVRLASQPLEIDKNIKTTRDSDVESVSHWHVIKGWLSSVVSWVPHALSGTKDKVVRDACVLRDGVVLCTSRIREGRSTNAAKAANTPCEKDVTIQNPSPSVSSFQSELTFALK